MSNPHASRLHRTFYGGLLLVLLLLLSACEHYEIAAKEKEEQNASSLPSIPLRVGEGTAEAPYTIRQARLHQQTSPRSVEGETVWVIGYLVGETYQSLGNALFEPPFMHDSNILLADDSLCQSPLACMPVALSSKAQKQKWGLVVNPASHRQCVLLQGNLQTYLGTLGLAKVKQYRILPHYTIPDSSPQEWTEHTYPYNHP